MIQLSGIFFLMLGFAMRYIVNRRIFKRRAVTGLEGFRSYERMLLTKFVEGTVKSLSVVFIVGGVILVVADYGSTKTKGHPTMHQTNN